MKLLMTGLVIVMFADNLARQGRKTRQPRKRFDTPQLGRRRLYDRVIKKILPLNPERVREGRVS